MFFCVDGNVAAGSGFSGGVVDVFNFGVVLVNVAAGFECSCVVSLADTFGLLVTGGRGGCDDVDVFEIVVADNLL